MGKRFAAFAGRYSEHFELKTRDISPQAQQYLCGLMQSPLRNMERMAEVVPDTNEQSFQHFLSASSWDERSLLDQVALEADSLLGGGKHCALLLDESGFTKKGLCSVGVARQYNGRQGKIDNCQVGVFAALNCKNRVTLIDKRLYLPTSWTDDPSRCEGVGIPESQRIFKTKPELALEMVRYNRRLGVRFAWVGFDGLYGNNPEFLRALDDDGEVFVGDVHKDQFVFLSDPEPSLPTRKSNRGRKPSKGVSQVKPVKVERWADEQPDSAWKRVELRQAMRGSLIVEVLHQEVWLWDGKESQARKWRLIVRREYGDRNVRKYSLSNAGDRVNVQRLAWMQGQRYWVERSFQDAKSGVGMAQYQARGWKSWQHHMALVMMAMLFMLRERLLNHESYPLLSCADIVRLLCGFLPWRNRHPDELMRQLDVRHMQRVASIEYFAKKQRVEAAAAVWLM